MEFLPQVLTVNFSHLLFTGCKQFRGPKSLVLVLYNALMQRGHLEGFEPDMMSIPLQ
jgi:hypothetical protein